ncbi:MAG: GGDEF and EAL domain-containing protein [Saccharofermentans sp.]|nr:GGDEF and EAL domain-containing protein [Saccharofermentans sp.]
MEELNRDILIRYAQTLSLEELKGADYNAIAGLAVIDTSNERIVFQGKLTSIFGPAANDEMYLETFFQLIPEYQRVSISARYKDIISDLITGAYEVGTVTHSVKSPVSVSAFVIEVSFKKILIDANNYLVGVVRDVTPDIASATYSKLMSDDMNLYIFSYDSVADVLHLNSRFAEDFEIPSKKLEHFTSNVSKYMKPDDAAHLNDVFVKYLSTGEANIGEELCFMTPGKGDLYLRLDAITNVFDENKEESRYISGILSDVSTDRVEKLRHDALKEGFESIEFTADINRKVLKFSRPISGLFPQDTNQVSGDFVEEIARHVVTKDRKRFRNAMYRAVNNPNSTFSVEFRIRPRGSSAIWVALRGKSYYDSIRHSNMMTGIIINLSNLNLVKEMIEKKEASNELTGLPTRDKLMNDMANIIRNPEVLSCALIIFDIADFHIFNDNYGRETGNSILSATASYLADNLPEEAKLYHIGVDTFALLWNYASRKAVSTYLDDICSRNNTAMVTPEGEFFVNFGIAASTYPEGDTAEDIFNNAEIALHKIKNNKALKYVIYSPADRLELSQTTDFISQISTCIVNGMENFQLYYQPLIDAKTGILKGAEALLRWQSNQGELVNPELVVKALEAADRMADVGKWIANEAAKQCAKWISKGAPRDFYIHINATADDLIRPEYAQEIKALLVKYNLTPDNLLVELTETSLMENMGKCRINLNELSEAGIRTALDDFGSGYSSFNYLKELPVDEIKIDKSFTDDMETSEFSASFIEAMTMLAHSIDMSVVVEGVETESQVNRLREMGADIFQGYYFGKPMSVFSFWNKYFG